jgi:hyperosmotically inducible periplasmic protein
MVAGRWSLVVGLLCISLLTIACGRERTSIRQSIDDATLATQVKTALLNEPGVPFTRVDVEASQGVVTLTGAVASKDEEQKVIAVVRGVKGVRDVQSALKIAPQ